MIEKSDKKIINQKISWDLLVIGGFTTLSFVEILSYPETTNLLSIILLVAFAYYTYSIYRIKNPNKESDKTLNKTTFLVGIAITAMMLIISVANFLMMSSGQLENDMGYLSILVIIALIKSIRSIKRKE